MSLLAVKPVSHSQTHRVLSQQRSQQSLPNSSPSSLAKASTEDRHGPYLCPPTPLPTLAAACSKGSRRSSASCCLPGTTPCLAAPATAARPAQGGPRPPPGTRVQQGQLGGGLKRCPNLARVTPASAVPPDCPGAPRGTGGVGLEKDVAQGHGMQGHGDGGAWEAAMEEHGV